MVLFEVLSSILQGECAHVLRAVMLEAMPIVLKSIAESILEDFRKDACHGWTHHLTQLEHLLCLVDIKVVRCL